MVKKQKTGKRQIAHNIALSVVRVIQRIQMAWTVWMDRRVNPLTLNNKKILLVLLVLVTSGYCTYLIIEGIIGKPSRRTASESISVPVWVAPADPKPPDEISQLMENLKRFSDSIRRYHPDEWEAMKRARPGLSDSLEMLEGLIKKQR